MSTYAIGDIQGCYTALMRLLEAIDFSDGDTLWLAGDLVNRGDQSLQTLLFIQSLGDRAKCVLGNHDLHLLATAHRVRKPSVRDTFDDILTSQHRDQLLDWLRQQPLIHYDETLNCVMTHAGIYPHWSLEQALCYAEEVHKALGTNNYIDFLHTMYGNWPERWSDDLTTSDRLRFIVNSFTRMRFVNRQGDLDMANAGPVGSQGEGLYPWFEQSRLPDSLNIVFGHWAALEQTRRPNFHNLDSGCVWGHCLTAMQLETRRRIRVDCY